MNKEKTTQPELVLSDYELELEKIVEMIKFSTTIEGIALLKEFFIKKTDIKYCPFCGEPKGRRHKIWCMK